MPVNHSSVNLEEGSGADAVSQPDLKITSGSPHENSVNCAVPLSDSAGPSQTSSRGSGPSIQMTRNIHNINQLRKPTSSMARIAIDSILHPDSVNATVVEALPTPGRVLQLRKQLETVPVREVFAAFNSMQASHNLHQLGLYVFFVALYIFIAVCTFPVTRLYDQNSLIEDVFLDEEFKPKLDTATGIFEGPVFKKNFYDIYSYEEYWEWVDGPLLEGIFRQTDYNGDPITDPASDFVLMGGNSGNRIVGSVQFRTAKVKANVRCKTLDPVPEKWGARMCYPRFHTDTQNLSAWPPFTQKSGMGTIRGLPGWGAAEPVLSIGGYGDSGYVWEVPLGNPRVDINGTTPLQRARDAVQVMKDNGWTNDATRVLAVDFNIAGLDLGNLVAVRFVVQVLQGGGFTKYWRAYPILTQPLERELNQLVFAIEILFLLLLMYYYYMTFVTFRNQPRKVAYLLSDFWACIDLINLFIFGIAFSMLFYAQFNKYDDAFVRSVTFNEHYTDIFDDARFTTYISIMMCFNLMIGMIKIFKFLRLLPYITIMWETLTKCFVELFYLTLSGMIVIIGFSFLGHFMFGMWIEDYHTLSSSASIIMRSLLGEASYDELRDTEPSFAPIYYVFVTFFVAFMFFNMFIAVIVEYYSIAKVRKKEKINFMRAVGTPMVISRTGAWRVQAKYWAFTKYMNKEKILPPVVHNLNPLKHIRSHKKGSNSLEKGASSTRKVKGSKAGRSLEKRFRSCPSNWNYDPPSMIVSERERWIAKARKRREFVASGGTWKSSDLDDITTHINDIRLSEQLKKNPTSKAAKMLIGGSHSRQNSNLDRDVGGDAASTAAVRNSGVKEHAPGGIGMLASLLRVTATKGIKAKETIAKRNENSEADLSGSATHSSITTDSSSPQSTASPGSTKFTSSSRHLSATSPPTSKVAAHMWKWTVQTLARERQYHLIRMRAYFSEPFPAQVERTRQLLERKFGPDTYFRNNWDSVIKERGLESKMRLLQRKVQNVRDRLRVSEILWRAHERQSKKHQRDLFRLFNRSFKRMTPRARHGELTKEDLRVLFGHVAGNIDADNLQCEADVDTLIELYNSKLRIEMLETSMKYESTTSLETVERKVVLLSDQLGHVVNILDEVVKKPMAAQQTTDIANPDTHSASMRVMTPHRGLHKAGSFFFGGRTLGQRHRSFVAAEPSIERHRTSSGVRDVDTKELQVIVKDGDEEPSNFQRHGGNGGRLSVGLMEVPAPRHNSGTS